MGINDTFTAIDVLERDINVEAGEIRYRLLVPALSATGAEQRSKAFLRREDKVVDVEVQDIQGAGRVELSIPGMEGPDMFLVEARTRF